MNPLSRRWALLLVSLVLAMGGPTGAQPAQKVKKASTAVEIPGQVEAFEQTPIHPRIAGYVQKISVDIGDRVKKGQLLVELSVPEIVAELRQKEALIVQAEAESELARRGLQVADAAKALAKAQVDEGEAGVKRAQASHERAKSEAERLDKLWQTKAIEKRLRDEGQQKLDIAKAAITEAQAKHKGAQAAHEGSTARREMSQSEVKLTLARLEVAKADAQRVGAILDFAKMRAPFDGVITVRNADVGVLAGTPTVGKAAPLLVVTRMDIVRIVVAVPEELAPSVTADTPVIVKFAALKGKEVEAKVKRASWALDHTRTLRAEIDLPNPDGTFRPGMFAAVKFPGTRADGDQQKKAPKQKEVPPAGELKSGPRAGTMIPGPFSPVDVIEGKRIAYVGEAFGANPFVVIFARNLNEPLRSLVTQLDQAVEQNKQRRLQAILVMLSDDDELEGRLKNLARDQKIKHVKLTIDNPSGPTTYHLAKDAAVTVLLCDKRKVIENIAFATGDLNECSVAQILAELPRIIDHYRPRSQ